MLFSDFAIFLEKLETTASRNEITNILSDLFKKAGASEIDKIVYLSLGQLAPNYEGVLLNLAEKMMIRAVAKAYEVTPETVSKLFKQKGDLGNVAQSLNKKQSSKLTVNDVFEKLISISKEGGNESQERKLLIMSDLLKDVDSKSSRFIARIPVGRLRLGFSDKTVMDALSALVKGDKSAKKEIEAAYNVRPDIGYLASKIKKSSIKNLAKTTSPEVGVPVAPMLAQRLNSPSEMIKKMGTVSVEPKYDGLRIFIHFNKKFVKIFTRNMNYIDPNIFPELKNLSKYIKAKEVILDTEAVGVDIEREELLDFQKTIQRRRKHDIEKSASGAPLQFQVFDIILCDGKNLINTPYTQRREILDKVVINGSLLKVDEHTITEDPKKINELMEKYIKTGYEGVVVKRANGLYVSGRTGWNWVKMKEKENAKGRLSDTVDCVVMGYTQGKGKRSSFGIGQFLAGIRDGDIFKTVTKVGTGLTDVEFRELENRLKKIKIKEKPKEYEVHKDLYPDFWVTPKVVVELAADEITKSPKHTSGLALRFPRLVKFRDDKSPRDITTLKELRELMLA